MSKGNHFESKGTDTFEVPVRETNTVKILETLSCVVQLPLHFSRKSGREMAITHQIQSIDGVFLDIFGDIPMLHPL